MKKLLDSLNEAEKCFNEDDDFNWKKGDKLMVANHKSPEGKGLSYGNMTVTAKEDGFSGGWDVWDGTLNGKDVSFYGFSVMKVVK